MRRKSSPPIGQIVVLIKNTIHRLRMFRNQAECDTLIANYKKANPSYRFEIKDMDNIIKRWEKGDPPKQRPKQFMAYVQCFKNGEMVRHRNCIYPSYTQQFKAYCVKLFGKDVTFTEEVVERAKIKQYPEYRAARTKPNPDNSPSENRSITWYGNLSGHLAERYSRAFCDKLPIDITKEDMNIIYHKIQANTKPF